VLSVEPKARLITLKTDFYSVQNVARSIFCDRFLLKCVQSTAANELCSAWLFVFQKKVIAKSRSRNILHWMEIRLYWTLIIRDITKTDFNNCFILQYIAFLLITLSTNNYLSHKTTFGFQQKRWKRFKISQ
jgi:hypothetical protein